VKKKIEKERKKEKKGDYLNSEVELMMTSSKIICHLSGSF
jgi:hypothetical protein